MPDKLPPEVIRSIREVPDIVEQLKQLNRHLADWKRDRHEGLLFLERLTDAVEQINEKFMLPASPASAIAQKLYQEAREVDKWPESKEE